VDADATYDSSVGLEAALDVSWCHTRQPRSAEVAALRASSVVGRHPNGSSVRRRSTGPRGVPSDQAAPGLYTLTCDEPQSSKGYSQNLELDPGL
jgi:hypothetical protein